MSQLDKDLPPSQLGTREYWDDIYSKEVENFTDHGDEGEIWFGGNVVKRLLAWLAGCPLVNFDSSILDIGTGNGMFLFKLSELGYIHLTGIDYSENSITLANQILQTHEGQGRVTFEVGDIVNPSGVIVADAAVHKKYDICTDKGTYDAISLDPDDAVTKRKKYIHNVHEILHNDGLLVLTSCNWTKEELIEQFLIEFELFGEIDMPQFTFGGQTGQKVASLVFKKKLKRLPSSASACPI